MNIKQIASMVFLASAVFVASKVYCAAAPEVPGKKIRVFMSNNARDRTAVYYLESGQSLSLIKPDIAKTFGIPVEQVKFKQKTVITGPDKEKKTSYVPLQDTTPLYLPAQSEGASEEILVIQAQQKYPIGTKIRFSDDKGVVRFGTIAQFEQGLYMVEETKTSNPPYFIREDQITGAKSKAAAQAKPVYSVVSFAAQDGTIHKGTIVATNEDGSCIIIGEKGIEYVIAADQINPKVSAAKTKRMYSLNDHVSFTAQDGTTQNGTIIEIGDDSYTIINTFGLLFVIPTDNIK